MAQKERELMGERHGRTKDHGRKRKGGHITHFEFVFAALVFPDARRLSVLGHADTVLLIMFYKAFSVLVL